MAQVRAPFRAPRARAHAGRWGGTVRRECLDWLLIVGERHLDRVLHEYVAHYNAARAHQALRVRAPVPRGHSGSTAGEVVRRDRLGGLIHEYERRAA
jgi:putative transposase